MKSAKLGMTITSLMVVASMMLAACGDTPTATPVAAPATNTVPAAAADSTNTPAAMVDATATTAMVEATATTGGGGTMFEGDTIKIGVDLPTSGADASSGVPARNGAELAIEQANARGGVKIGDKTYKLEMYALDDAINGVHNPEQGAKNAQSFVADPAVLGVLGPFNSNVARAMMPILNNAGLSSISPSNTGPSLTKPEYGEVATLRPTGKQTYFRVCATDDFQGPAAADFMYDKLNLRNIYILDDTETYGKGIADQVNMQFVKRGGKVIAQEGVPKGTTDYRTILTKIAGSTPAADGIFYGGTTSNGLGLARKQMADAGLTIPFMGGDGIQEDQFITDAGEESVGSYSTVAAVNSETLPAAQQFITDYTARYSKEDLGAYSAPMFDAANIMIAAMERGGKPDRESVRLALLDGTKYSGTIGETSFDENGDTTNKWISIYEVKADDAGVLKWTFVDQKQYE
jgi:branched-chain amino acid transport system substrate-binding protein